MENKPEIEVCRICLNIVDFKTENSLNEIVLEMFNLCLPEIDLNLSNNPIICNSCENLLRLFYNFKSNCLRTERRIMKYKEINKADIERVNLLMLIDQVEMPEDKIETLPIECDVKVEPEYISLEELEKEMKIEKNIGHKSESTGSTVKVEKETNDEEFLFANCGNENEIQENIADDKDICTNLENDNLPWYTCDICPYKTRWRQHVKRHQLIHEAESGSTKNFNCLKCGFVSNYKHALHKHSVLEHGTWFKCDQCQYQTKWKRMYNQHLLMHQGGLSWFHCEQCSYKSKWKYHVKRHMVTHQ